LLLLEVGGQAVQEVEEVVNFGIKIISLSPLGLPTP